MQKKRQLNVIMGKRRKGRELALRCLYSLEMLPTGGVEERLADIIREEGSEKTTQAFAGELLSGVKENQDYFDLLISQYATNWSLDRVAVIDRNILRLSLYEMLRKNKEIPPAVCIDEAVELAKAYGSEDSYRFINGILNKVKEDLDSGKLDFPQKGP